MKRMNDAVVQSRVDKRCLATVSKWYLSKGRMPRSASELVRSIVEDFVEVLVSNGKVKMIDNSEDARQLLDSLFDNTFNPGRRGRENEYRNLALDDLERAPSLCINDPGYLKTATQCGISLEDVKAAYVKARNYKEIVKPEPFEVDENGLVINRFVEPKQIIPEWAKKETENKKEMKPMVSKNTLDELAPAPIDVEEWKKKAEEKRKMEEEAIREFNPLDGAIKEI